MSILLWNCRGLAIGAEEEELDLDEADVECVADERRARPPSEPPPWSTTPKWIQFQRQKIWVLVQVNQFGRQIKLFSCIFLFPDYSVCFGFCFVFVFPFRETIDLDMGNKGIGVTVCGSFVPINGSASYITSVEVINSESDSRDSGCQDSVCRITHYLNVEISI
ncbi:unnamed protein product [Cuscuta europaea]|uniref:Uncharacterized protein n=1 Tax=Cuscuta europaea TaxID=41803 RepID=A0A9P0Z3A0_CUSEU|nr:unnamed protein product [Cuscuta europaea]